MKDQLKTEIKRINGYLKEVTTFFDDSGRPITHIVNPLMVELNPRDMLQIFVGAFVIGSPLSFTEEVWKLSVDLAMANIFALVAVSLFRLHLLFTLTFIAIVYMVMPLSFFKRVLATYLITASSVVMILLLIDKFPIQETPDIALKRAVIICFPALFGAVISDYLK